MINRLTEFIKHENITEQQFAAKIGISQSTLSAQKNRKGKFSQGVQDKIYSAFPNLNRDWLIYGEGEMIKQISKYQPTSLFDLETETPEKSANYEPKNVEKNVSEYLANRNIEPKKPDFTEIDQKKISEQPKIVEKIIERVIEKTVDKKIVRITVFYDNNTYEELI
ncbi:MAG: helix-turn-helix domain-containing protein [Prevotellaceae bacterium]|jgi:transcriptional regulator with XRE-family HTH domain|nr:helix-turn-helix domain-containing protein [Prevotellaceae bacterium]